MVVYMRIGQEFHRLYGCYLLSILNSMLVCLISSTHLGWLFMWLHIYIVKKIALISLVTHIYESQIPLFLFRGPVGTRKITPGHHVLICHSPGVTVSSAAVVRPCKLGVTHPWHLRSAPDKEIYNGRSQTYQKKCICYLHTVGQYSNILSCCINPSGNGLELWLLSLKAGVF